MSTIRKIESVNWESLKAETITEVVGYSKEYQEYTGLKTFGYQYQILVCKSGKQFVVTQCMGEVHLSEIIRQ